MNTYFKTCFSSSFILPMNSVDTDDTAFKLLEIFFAFIRGVKGDGDGGSGGGGGGGGGGAGDANPLISF